MYIYMDTYFENVKFIVVNLKLDVEQYIIFFYHNFLQTDYDKFYIVRIYNMYTHIYIYIMFCSHFSTISHFYHCTLFRYFIVIQKIHSKYIYFQFSFIDFLNNFINSTVTIFPFIFCLFYFSVLIFFSDNFVVIFFLIPYFFVSNINCERFIFP